MFHADVIVPLPLPGTFTYRIPSEFEIEIKVGCRVVVQFGKKKYYTGIVYKLYEVEENKPDLKEITSLLDRVPIIYPRQFEFWEWVSAYYMCTLGEVYKAALPSALKPESETIVYRDNSFEADNKFTPNEEKIFYALSEDKPTRISELERKTGITNVIPYIKSLSEKGAVFFNENLKKKYTAKTETAIRLKRNFSDEELTHITDNLIRAKKQQHLFLAFLGLREECENPDQFFILKKQLIEESGQSPAIIDALVQKDYLEAFPYEVSRLNYDGNELLPEKKLSTYQQEAYEEIVASFQEKDVCLLHGITSSGKTEIYIKMIKEAMRRGGHVLYLLPEIALTTQITQRLRSVFGKDLLVYHSRFNDNERAETWNTLLHSKESKIVLGARSAVFLPFSSLSLVIVDEEHEASYKQHDPAPRYNGKNSALVLASLFHAKTLLGTATPSIETYYNALSGRYGLVTLDKRYEEIELPQITVVDTKELRRRKQMKSILSPPLSEEIKSVLKNSGQVILFQNRRGFAPMLECKTCSWTPKCLHCDVSLTYHKAQNSLICHYCGAVYSIPSECPECMTPTLQMQGYGTERIQEVVAEEFPEAVLSRMDLDTTRNKFSYEKIISNFESHKSDILIGTQMVSKGLDFDNVSLVGILNADGLLNYPDFRAHERAFQLMMQVSGRAGRKQKRGEVILQTGHPGHPVITFVKTHDYLSFYHMQLEERRLFRYPPFYRLIEIVVRGKDESLTETMARQFSEMLRETFHDRLLGPVKPVVPRVQSLYIRKIVLKIEHQASPAKVKDIIETYQKYIQANPSYKSILLHYDVDPM